MRDSNTPGAPWKCVASTLFKQPGVGVVAAKHQSRFIPGCDTPTNTKRSVNEIEIGSTRRPIQDCNQSDNNEYDLLRIKATYLSLLLWGFAVEHSIETASCWLTICRRRVIYAEMRKPHGCALLQRNTFKFKTFCLHFSGSSARSCEHFRPIAGRIWTDDGQFRYDSEKARTGNVKISHDSGFGRDYNVSESRSQSQ